MIKFAYDLMSTEDRFVFTFDKYTVRSSGRITENSSTTWVDVYDKTREKDCGLVMVMFRNGTTLAPSGSILIRDDTIKFISSEDVVWNTSRIVNDEMYNVPQVELDLSTEESRFQALLSEDVLPVQKICDWIDFVYTMPKERWSIVVSHDLVLDELQRTFEENKDAIEVKFLDVGRS